MNRSRRLITLAVLAAMAAVLTGCLPLITADSASQDVMGDVIVDTTVCSSPLYGVILTADDDNVLDDVQEDFCKSVEAGHDWHYPSTPDSTLIYRLPLPGQVLASYRVSEGFEAPEEITATVEYVDHLDWWAWVEDNQLDRRIADTVTEGPAARTVDITFRRSTDLDEKLALSYALAGEEYDELSDEERAQHSIDILGDGQKIVSYVSDIVPGAIVGDVDLEAGFALPEGARPQAPTFNHVTMLGWRAAMTDDMIPEILKTEPARAARMLRTRGNVLEGTFGELEPDREFNCTIGRALLVQLTRPEDEELEERSAMQRGGPLADLTVCPWPELPFAEGEELRAELDGAFDGADTPTRDLDLRGSGETFVEQGNTATVPFSVLGAGPAGQKVDLTASISPAIPGVGAIKQEIDFPGAGTHGRTVEIKVPADAPARTYEVLVTASKGGRSRTAKAGLVVLPKPAAAPAPAAPKPPVGRDNIYVGEDGTIRFGTLCGTCTVDVLVPFGSLGSARSAQAQKPRLMRVAKAGVKGTPGVRKVVKVKLFPKAKRAVRGGRRIKGLIVTRQSRAGKPEVRRIVIRRKGK